MALLLVNFLAKKKMEMQVKTPKIADGNLAANSDTENPNTWDCKVHISGGFVIVKRSVCQR